VAAVRKSPKVQGWGTEWQFLRRSVIGGDANRPGAERRGSRSSAAWGAGVLSCAVLGSGKVDWAVGRCRIVRWLGWAGPASIEGLTWLGAGASSWSAEDSKSCSGAAAGEAALCPDRRSVSMVGPASWVSGTSLSRERGSRGWQLLGTTGWGSTEASCSAEHDVWFGVAGDSVSCRTRRSPLQGMAGGVEVGSASGVVGEATNGCWPARSGGDSTCLGSEAAAVSVAATGAGSSCWLFLRQKRFLHSAWAGE
jgi:hypothetical protein